jgi:hypothetical protein
MALQAALIAVAIVLLVLYLGRRRARVNREL